VVKKALSKLNNQVSEEEYFLGSDIGVGDWLSEASQVVEGELAVDVFQTDAEIVIKAPLAGVAEDDVEITVQPDQISVRGERKEEREVSEDNYHARECYWGTFSRTVVLPVEISPEGAKAVFKKGILTIRLPKAKKSTSVKLKIAS
jgi:HSP20 family protein